MKKLEIFEPALCCSTGVCGPEPDQQLIELQNIINWLKKANIEVQRYAINQQPLAFTKNEKVKEYIKANGPGKLPVVLLDGEIRKEGAYPTAEELKEWIPDLRQVKQPDQILGSFS
jgi:arsenite/tail-anchored protein-transporting ATPase